MRSLTLLLSVSLLLTALPAQAQHRPKPKQGKSSVLERTKRSVVTITTDKGVLSGFFVSNGSMVLTSAHGVFNASSLAIRDFAGRTWKPTEIALDIGADLALLRLPTAAPCPPLKIQTAAMRLRSGDPIYVVGNPLGFLDSTVTNGIVSGSRSVEGVPYLQITAPISHGSSGSPVINNEGYVVGLVKGAIEEGQALNFAVAAKQIRSFLYKPDWSKTEDLYSLNKSIGDASDSDDHEKAAGVARVVIVISMAKTLYDLSVAESYQFNLDVDGPTMRGWEDTSRLKRALAKAVTDLGDLKKMEELEDEYPDQEWRDAKVDRLLKASDQAVEALEQTPKQLSAMEEAAGSIEEPESKEKFSHNFELVIGDLKRAHTLLTTAITRECEPELLDAIEKSKVGMYIRFNFPPPDTDPVVLPFLPDLDLGEMVVRLPLNSGAWTSGLKPQDTVLQVDGEPVETLYDVAKLLAKTKSTHKFRVKRNGKQVEVEVQPRGDSNS